jgi:hypothetical protein
MQALSPTGGRRPSPSKLHSPCSPGGACTPPLLCSPLRSQRKLDFSASVSPFPATAFASSSPGKRCGAVQGPASPAWSAPRSPHPAALVPVSEVYDLCTALHDFSVPCAASRQQMQAHIARLQAALAKPATRGAAVVALSALAAQMDAASPAEVRACLFNALLPLMQRKPGASIGHTSAEHSEAQASSSLVATQIPSERDSHERAAVSPASAAANGAVVMQQCADGGDNAAEAVADGPDWTRWAHTALARLAGAQAHGAGSPARAQPHTLLQPSASASSGQAASAAKLRSAPQARSGQRRSRQEAAEAGASVRESVHQLSPASDRAACAESLVAHSTAAVARARLAHASTVAAREEPATAARLGSTTEVPTAGSTACSAATRQVQTAVQRLMAAQVGPGTALESPHHQEDSWLVAALATAHLAGQDADLSEELTTAASEVSSKPVPSQHVGNMPEHVQACGSFTADTQTLPTALITEQPHPVQFHVPQHHAAAVQDLSDALRSTREATRLAALLAIAGILLSLAPSPATVAAMSPAQASTRVAPPSPSEVPPDSPSSRHDGAVHVRARLGRALDAALPDVLAGPCAETCTAAIDAAWLATQHGGALSCFTDGSAAPGLVRHLRTGGCEEHVRLQSCGGVLRHALAGRMSGVTGALSFCRFPLWPV